MRLLAHRLLAPLLASLVLTACTEPAQHAGIEPQGPVPEPPGYGPAPVQTTRNDVTPAVAIEVDSGAARGADPTPGDAGSATPDQSDAATSGAAEGTSSPGCRFSLWPSPDAGVIDYYCWPQLTASQCSCQGTLQTARGLSAETLRDPASCLALIADSCHVDTNLPTYCEHAYGGGCWPAGEERWLCECERGGARREVTGASCKAAGDALCKPPPERCEEVVLGRCSGEQGAFTCQCVVDTTTVMRSESSCSEALRTACTPASPTNDGKECTTPGFASNTTPSGRCSARGRDPSDGYECQCNLPDGQVRQDKPRVATCEQALAIVCPEAAAE